MFANGSTASSDFVSGETGMIVGDINGNSSTSNIFGNGSIYIPNYAGSNNKSVSTNVMVDNNATESSQYLLTGLWSDSSAITTIRLYSRNSHNFLQYSTAYLYGVTSAGYGAKATGGNYISQDANYYYHIFTSTGTFTPTQSLTADYLVVAGGAGGGGGNNTVGGSRSGGGGGAGGLRCTVDATGGGGNLESPLLLSATSYSVTIGAGGAAGSTDSSGSNGSNSVFSTITATGGGGGGRGGNGTNAGLTGGSGGGGGSSNTTPGAGGSGTANQGYAGATANGGNGSGGGGGAGGVGLSITTLNGTPISSPNGGIGVLTTMAANGIATYYAGGGGGSVSRGSGLGGLGGGGNGAYGYQLNTNATAGTPNTGGGGGGGTSNDDNGNIYASAAGGSGIVVIRYAK